MSTRVEGAVDEHSTGPNAGNDAFLSKQAHTKDFIHKMRTFTR